MKTVLIVDDERPARELLKMSLDWGALGFAPPIEAPNGARALEEYQRHHPDFIITDIQMPVMDGLDLIREIKAIHPNQRIVILSCHESFSFAQKAIKMGVMDYLIKDALNPGALAEILLADEVGSAIENVSPHSVPQILKPLLNGDLLDEQAAEQLKPYLQKRGFYCCTVSGAKSSSDDVRLARAREALSNELVRAAGGDVCWTGENTFCILALFPQTVSAMDSLSYRTRLIKALRETAERELEKPITIGVSSESTDASRLSQKIAEAQTALQSFVFLGRGKTIYFDEAQTSLRVSSVKTLNLRIERIKKALRDNNFEDARGEIVLLYQKELSGMMQYNYLLHVNTLLLSALTECCMTHGIPFEEVFGSEMVTQLPVLGCETADEMLSWYLSCFDKYFANMRGQLRYEQSPRVQKIKQYIETNYDQDISLETVAERFGLHKVYLAKVFKQEMDQSVNEYIRIVKTEKAKELLAQEHLRINTIIEMLGFNNPQTFYNMFKHSVGISPKEYREQLKESLAGIR